MLQVLPKKKPVALSSRYDPYEDVVVDDAYMSLFDGDGMLNEEEEEMSDEGNMDGLDGGYAARSDREMDSDGEGEHDTTAEKEEDEVMEGDIVVVTLPAEPSSNHMLQNKSPMVHFSRSLSLPKRPETPSHKEKERRAVVVRTMGKDRVALAREADA